MTEIPKSQYAKTTAGNTVSIDLPAVLDALPCSIAILIRWQHACRTRSVVAARAVYPAG
jgi:hypothetical protein